MSASTNIIPLAPKSKSGNTQTARFNITWSVNFDKGTRQFHWRIVVPMNPQVFTGQSGTMAEAQQEVDKIMSNFK